MPLRGADGRFYGWCVVCQGDIPKAHKTLRIHLSKAHQLELLPGCPHCFYYRSRWSDVKKHCTDQHRLDIDSQHGAHGCAWGLTVLDSSRHRPSYAYVSQDDICQYPLAQETLSPQQTKIRDRAGQEAVPSTSREAKQTSSRSPRASSAPVSHKRPRTRSATRQEPARTTVVGKGKGRGKSSRPRPSPVELPPREASASPSPVGPPPREASASPSPSSDRQLSSTPVPTTPGASTSGSSIPRRSRRRRTTIEEISKRLSSTVDSSTFETVSGLESSPAIHIPVLDESEPLDASVPQHSTPRRSSTGDLPADLPSDVEIVYPEAPETLRQRRPRKSKPSLTSTPESQPPTPGAVQPSCSRATTSQQTSAAVDASTSTSVTTATVETQTDVSLPEDVTLLAIPRTGGHLNITPF